MDDICRHEEGRCGTKGSFTIGRGGGRGEDDDDVGVLDECSVLRLSSVTLFSALLLEHALALRIARSNTSSTADSSSST